MFRWIVTCLVILVLQSDLAGGMLMNDYHEAWRFDQTRDWMLSNYGRMYSIITGGDCYEVEDHAALVGGDEEARGLAG